MPITWDDRADAKLLAGVLLQNSSGLDFAALAEYMGDGCTISALRHRIVRIKKKVADDENLMNAGQSNPGTPSTPAAKRKRAPNATPRATPTKLKKETSSDDDDKQDLIIKGNQAEAEEGGETKKLKPEDIFSDEYERFVRKYNNDSED
ncbi:hypothetical protein N7508_004959 [Penicillium antarcticum]|uniref:uncharacterized protein n=1 Tax=Penicillium antarcticum TaxID=416450 RepID=UPI0023A2963E|nr:uncharacterized protein N7508_004959 [Penicillium antarcticum]KAJ5305944.1 hypothetical protein N7508_004959 [Penicillium antarcticum]